MAVLHRSVGSSRFWLKATEERLREHSRMMFLALRPVNARVLTSAQACDALKTSCPSTAFCALVFDLFSDLCGPLRTQPC